MDIYYLALVQYLSHDKLLIQQLVAWIGRGSCVREALGQIYERWDGKGSPNRLKRKAILLPLRVVRIAQDAYRYHRLEETELLCAVLRKLAGALYDPQIVDCFCKHAEHLFEETKASSPWDAVLAAEPGEIRRVPHQLSTTTFSTFIASSASRREQQPHSSLCSITSWQVEKMRK